MIDKTLAEIHKAQEVLALPVPDEMKFRPGYEMAQREAKLNLEKLLSQLGEHLSSVAVTVYVDGEQAPALAAAMQNITDAAVVDLDKIYAPLVAQVAQSIGRNKEFGVNQFALIIRELRQLAAANQLAAIQTPQFTEPFVFQDDAQLTKLVVDYANKAVGVELAVNYIRKQVSEQASKISTKQVVPVYPVFVLNCRLDRDLLTQKLFRRGLGTTITAPTEVNDEAAINALKSVKKYLKQTKE